MGIKHEAVKASGDKGLASEWNANHVVDGDVDIDKHSWENQVIENLASAPAGPVEGQVYYDTTLKEIRCWNGTEWRNIINTTYQNYFYNVDDVEVTINRERKKILESVALTEGIYFVSAWFEAGMYREFGGWMGLQGRIYINGSEQDITGGQSENELDVDEERQGTINISRIVTITAGQKIQLYVNIVSDSGTDPLKVNLHEASLSIIKLA